MGIKKSLIGSGGVNSLATKRAILVVKNELGLRMLTSGPIIEIVRPEILLGRLTSYKPEEVIVQKDIIFNNEKFGEVRGSETFNIFLLKGVDERRFRSITIGDMNSLAAYLCGRWNAAYLDLKSILRS